MMRLGTRALRLLTLPLLVFCALLAEAGGPLIVGGPGYGKDAKPFIWNPAAMPIHYRVDGGPMAQTPSGTTVISNAAGLTRVQNMLQVWHNVPTASLSFTNDGAISKTGIYTDGNVSNADELNAVMDSCDAGAQTPVVFDANGGIIAELGMDPHVIGFAGMCSDDAVNGYILSGVVLLNGMFQDGVTDLNNHNHELTAAEFDEAFVHEFGHLLGLDHSQINVEVLNGYSCTQDDLAGLPVMFPYAVCEAKVTYGFSTLAPDDAAWISKLYPSPSYATTYGTISGYILFSDGISHAQGVNVIARRVENPDTAVQEARTTAFSVVSGFLFTSNPGQSVTGTNDGGSEFGSRDPLLIGYYEIPVLPGDYTVEVQSILPEFEGGSGVGPLSPPIPLAGAVEFWNQGDSATDDVSAKDPVTVTAGQTVKDITIILNGTPPRFDQFETGIATLGSNGSSRAVRRWAITPFGGAPWAR